MSLQGMFEVIDKDTNKNLDINEFRNTLLNLGDIDLNQTEVEALF